MTQESNLKTTQVETNYPPEGPNHFPFNFWVDFVMVVTHNGVTTKLDGPMFMVGQYAMAEDTVSI